ncbi:MAG: thioredoxin family protein [Planctomycetaceae bacterium]
MPNVDGKSVAESFFGKPLLVVFMCNRHCPFVIHLRDQFVKFASEYEKKGLAVVGISSNDVATHPDDSPARMKEDAKKYGYTFPYLYDESQSVAKAYQAACTPDFFVFDKQHKLVYRGQFDDSRPQSSIPVTGARHTRRLRRGAGRKGRLQQRSGRSVAISSGKTGNAEVLHRATGGLKGLMVYG